MTETDYYDKILPRERPLASHKGYQIVLRVGGGNPTSKEVFEKITSTGNLPVEVFYAEDARNARK